MTDGVTFGAGPAEGLTYAAALAELREILALMEDESLDVDALTAQVRRAAHLITFCRERITAAGVEVERVVAELAEEEPPGSG